MFSSGKILSGALIGSNTGLPLNPTPVRDGIEISGNSVNPIGALMFGATSVLSIIVSSFLKSVTPLMSLRPLARSVLLPLLLVCVMHHLQELFQDQ